MKPGWYVNKNDPLDVVFVTGEIIQMKYPAHRIISYVGLKNNEPPKKTVAGWGFNDYYTPIDPEIHAKALHDSAILSLRLSEAIRDAQKAISSTPNQGGLEQTVQTPQSRADGIPIVHHKED